MDERQAFNHFVIVELLEIFEIEMPKSLMPQLAGVIGIMIQEDIGGHPPIPLGPPPWFLSVFQFP